jgi:hypothetical protein
MLSETNRDFTSGYNDFRYENIPQLDPQESPRLAQDSLTSSLDRDNERLGFQPPTYNFTLLDHSFRRTSVSLNARLHGMFFIADEVPATPDLYSQMQAPLQPRPELTCYRRNLFQAAGSITLPRGLRYILTDNGDRITIVAQELAVSATESVEDHPVKLISVPWKTPVNNPSTVPEDKTEREPTTIPLDTMSNQDMDADYTTFPIAWKRLQFRIATANNGRRKELQQHFIARLKLIATLSTGERVAIAEARSAAIVVRGRSPRNFQQRKDLAVGGEKSGVRKGLNSPASLPRRATADDVPSKSPLTREHGGDNPFAASFNYPHRASDPTSSSNNFSSGNWKSPNQGHSSAPAMPTPTFKTPTLPSSKSPSTASPPSIPHPPQPLSLMDDFSHDSATSTSSTAQKRPSTQRPQKPRRVSENRPHPYKQPSLPTLPSTKTLLSNTNQTQKGTADPADTLYEYFPLSNNDYMPPVDSVYRPHVVHHIAAGTPAPATSAQGYFGGNVS